MREILFRGKTTKDDWVYGTPCKSQDGLEMVGKLYHVDGSEWNVYSAEIIPQTVGQFTGLTDKNGTKIFEGDKLKDQDISIGIVLWNQDDCSFSVSWNNGDLFESLHQTDSKFYEITGNINDKQ